MDEFEFIVTKKDAFVAIDFNRPEEGNAMTRPMMEKLALEIRRAASDEETRAVVLKARGDMFCRGRDGRGEAPLPTPYERRVKGIGPILGVYEAIQAASVPVVALVQGAAIGFGAALAGASDITLASDKASFAFTEIQHEIPPTLAMSAVLRNVPPKALTYLIYSAETLSAFEAVGFGLASRVFAHDEFDALSAEFLAKLTSRPRVVLETVKKFQFHATGASPALASEYAGALMTVVRS